VERKRDVNDGRKAKDKETREERRNKERNCVKVRKKQNWQEVFESTNSPTFLAFVNNVSVALWSPSNLFGYHSNVTVHDYSG
jgi:hypothetical protein